jgi:hypothetical protein
MGSLSRRGEEGKGKWEQQALWRFNRERVWSCASSRVEAASQAYLEL